MTETKEEITIKDLTVEDLINIWICLEKQIIQLKTNDKKASEDIEKTFYKFLKLKINIK